ncbi:MAG TPA: GEVED domain-containing protein, partial [Chitinophagaceae bacterium]|nr:GEVED domain-containing protein [Chitinophagaceae bacterium]
ETDTTPAGHFYSRALSTCYCQIPQAANVCSNWISQFQTSGGTSDINQVTGCDSSSYSDFSAISASIMQGDTLGLMIKMGNGPLHYGVWVDMNNNSYFDYEERIAYSTDANQDSVNASWVVPTGLAAGNYRMRVVVEDQYPNYGCSSFNTGEYEDYTLTVTERPVCDVLPSNPVIVSDTNNFCPYNTITMSFQNIPNVSGLDYQWYFSSDSLTWELLPEDTFSNLSVYLAESGFYKGRITCSTGEDSVFTPVFKANVTVSQACYCIPGRYNGCQMYISRVRTSGGVQNIDNASDCSANGFTDYSDSLTIVQYQNDTLTFTLNSDPYPLGFAAWIDYNDNSNFDYDEQIFINYNSYVYERNINYIV